MIWNFLTFPKYWKQKFWKKIELKFLTLPPGEKGIKNEVIEKLVGELKLQNMIFRTHNNKTKSQKRSALFLTNWGS